MVIAHSDGESLAAVVVGPAQLIEQEGSLSVTGRLVRRAMEEDIVHFGRRGAAALEALPAALDQVRASHAGADVKDTWLAPDGSRLTVVLSERPSQSGGLGVRGGDSSPGTGAERVRQELAKSLGLPVDLDLTAEEESPRPATARAFMERLFKGEDQR